MGVCVRSLLAVIIALFIWRAILGWDGSQPLGLTGKGTSFV